MTTDLALRAPDDPIARLVNAWLDGQDSDHTIRGYRADIDLWIERCRADGVDPLRARHAQVKIWLRERLDAGDSEATSARRLASVWSWYRWLLQERHGAVEYNPADLGRSHRPTVDRTLSTTMALSAGNAELLVAAADADRNPRSAAIVSILLFDGLRVAELGAARVDDVDHGSGQPLLTVHGKGRRQRVVPIPPPAWQRWQRYDAARLGESRLLPATTVSAATSRRLVSTATGGRITQPEVWRLLRRLGKEGGLPPEVVAKLSPHVLRHTCATILLDSGEPLHKVQAFLGHADASTTQRYDHTEHKPENSPAYKLMTLLRLA